MGAESSQASLSGLGELKAVLRIKPFRRLWAVLGLSSLGDWLGLLATLAFATQQVTGSAAQGAAFGSVVAFRLMPALILGPIAGVFADRFDRRYTMTVCDLIRFVFFASMPLVALMTDDAAIVLGWVAIATFIIEAVVMLWTPAKEAALPNLLPRARLEKANQLTLGMTYSVTPVCGALLLAGMTTGLNSLFGKDLPESANPTHIALYFNALTFLATALTVFFGIKEISGRSSSVGERRPGVITEFIQGWSFVSSTPLIRGLTLGILGAFAAAGVVIGTSKFYAMSLGGGESTFYIMFAMLFLGLGIGVVAGPRMIGALSRRRWFGLSLILASASIVALALAWHLALAVVFAPLVGVGAGMAFLSGVTLMGGEVDDEVRGRSFAFVQTGTRVVLLLAVTISSVIVGAGGSREVGLGAFTFSLSTTRLLLGFAGLLGIGMGIFAFRQMDDKRGVPVLADLIGSLRGRPLSAVGHHVHHGLFVVFEGGEGAGKSTQADLLAQTLRERGRSVVVTREPGATEAGKRIRSLLLDGQDISPKSEALLYAADRADHVSSVISPALARGDVVISDRYIDSSLAYQGAGRVLAIDEISWLSHWATGGLKPDLIVLLDIDPTIGLERVGTRGRTDRLENESVDFHERVRYAFLDFASADPARYLVVDACDSPESIATMIARRVESLISVVPYQTSGPMSQGPGQASGSGDTSVIARFPLTNRKRSNRR